LDLLGANEGKDWSEPLVPELELQLPDYLGLNTGDFLEIDNGGMLETEDAVQFHPVKGAPEGVGLRDRPS
jgi:hypothetical protein